MTSRRRLLEVARTVLAILIALALALIAVFSVSKKPGEALSYFLLGPFNSLRHIGNVVELMIPLVFTGLSVAVMFSARQFNLGSEGGFFIGAIAATAIAVEAGNTADSASHRRGTRRRRRRNDFCGVPRPSQG